MSVQISFEGQRGAWPTLNAHFPSRIDEASFIDIIRYGWVVDAQCTLLSGVKKKIRYERTPGPQTSLAEALSSAVARSVEKSHAVGCMISGGLDSTIVLAALAGVTDKTIHAFTIAFGESDDETARAKLVADAFGVTHHTLWFKIPEALEKARTWAKLSPSGRFVYLPVLEEAARLGIDTLFSGEGGDEAFAGYAQRYLRMLKYHKYRPARRLAGPASLLPGRWGRMAGILGHTAFFEEFYAAWQTRVPDIRGGHEIPAGEGGEDWMARILRLERNLKLVDYLAHIQCCSVAYGVKVGYPLLDASVESFSSTREWSRMWDGHTLHGKYPLVEALKTMASPEIVRNATMPKHGFSPPSMDKWWSMGLCELHKETVRGPLRDLLPRSLLELGDKPSAGKRSLYAAALDAWCVDKFIQASPGERSR